MAESQASSEATKSNPEIITALSSGPNARRQLLDVSVICVATPAGGRPGSVEWVVVIGQTSKVKAPHQPI
jgi:hypothetical protein